MSAPVHIWLEMAHHAAFRVGGWAFVRRSGDVVSGFAGGERRIDPERASLTALCTALADLSPRIEVDLQTASPALLAIPSQIAAALAGESAPIENLDLWAKASTTLTRASVVIRRADPAPGGPAAFAAAWADLARDRAKDKGAFTAAIPRPNLAKSGI